MSIRALHDHALPLLLLSYLSRHLEEQPRLHTQDSSLHGILISCIASLGNNSCIEVNFISLQVKRTIKISTLTGLDGELEVFVHLEGHSENTVTKGKLQASH